MEKVRFSKEYRQLLKSPQWLIIRAAVKRRDNYRCVKCGTKGSRGNRLECDHKRYMPHGSSLQALINQPLSDYQTLCAKCHAQKTKAERKSRAKR